MRQCQIDLGCVQCSVQRQPVERSVRVHLPGITGLCPKPGFKLFTGELTVILPFKRTTHLNGVSPVPCDGAVFEVFTA